MKKSSPSQPSISLRELKKQRTRNHIIDVAASLFHEHGFDAVTVTDIARAAEVGEQTVYNYFTTKEGLVFDEAEAFADRIATMIRRAPLQEPLVVPIRQEALSFLDAMTRRPPNPHRHGGMPYLIVTNAAVRKGWLTLVEHFSVVAAESLMARSKGRMPRAAARILGGTIVSVFVVIVDAMGEAIRDNDDINSVVAKLKPQIDVALGFLDKGLGTGNTLA